MEIAGLFLDDGSDLYCELYDRPDPCDCGDRGRAFLYGSHDYLVLYYGAYHIREHKMEDSPGYAGIYHVQYFQYFCICFLLQRGFDKIFGLLYDRNIGTGLLFNECSVHCSL